jgi:hypothetical protein
LGLSAALALSGVLGGALALGRVLIATRDEAERAEAALAGLAEDLTVAAAFDLAGFDVARLLMWASDHGPA